MMPYPPLGTLYAASVVRNAGYSVALFDSMLAESEEEIRSHIQQHQPKVVVIYDDDFNYLTKMCLTRMREAAFRMAKIAKAERCPVIVHGSDPVDHLQEYFAHDVDFVICGEGEQTLLETLTHMLKPDKPKQSIDGLAYAVDGNVLRNPERAVVKDLDAILSTSSVIAASGKSDTAISPSTW
ncbi:MAG: Radical domain protein [Bacteroidetes bacterium]|nr:Radical domain protein [Bacteroidota bacterium]